MKKASRMEYFVALFTTQFAPFLTLFPTANGHNSLPTLQPIQLECTTLAFVPLSPE